MALNATWGLFGNGLLNETGNELSMRISLAQEIYPASYITQSPSLLKKWAGGVSPAIAFRD